MGIKNYAFLLSLNNPELIGVDPHDPFLTTEQKAMVAYEAKVNYWYALREVLRAPGQAGGDDEYITANRSLIAVSWYFLNHITPIVVQPRQTGKTFASTCMVTWLMNIRCLKTEIALLTKDDTLRASTVGRVREVELTLPTWMRQRTSKDKSNTEELSIGSLGNRFIGHVPNRSPKLAANVGRGLTTTIFLIDELAFIANIGISLPVALAGGVAVRDIARRNGEPYGSIYMTTAGKLDDPDGAYAHSLLDQAASHTEQFYDCVDEEALLKAVRSASKNDDATVNCTFSHRQLGYTDEWLARAIRESRAVGSDADRDFGNKWTSGTASHPLPVSILEVLSASKKEPLHVTIHKTHGYVVRWYIKEEEIEAAMRRSTVMGVDSSNASGRDDTAFVIRSISTGEVLAACNLNESNLIHISEWFLEMLKEWSSLVMIIENRSSGTYILDYLVLGLLAAGEIPHRRLYNNVVDEIGGARDTPHPLLSAKPWDREQLYARYKSQMGFTTSGSGKTSRMSLYGTTLVASTKYTGGLTHDPQTINQILSLIEKNGRIDHPIGGHDDLVIAYLLSYWFLASAKNLSHYGIDTHQVLRKVSKVDGLTNHEEAYWRARGETLRQDISLLVKAISDERDDILKQRGRTLLSVLVTELSELPAQDKLSTAGFIESLNTSKKDRYLR
jgi:hypothetical protein